MDDLQWLLNIEASGPRGKSFNDAPIVPGLPVATLAWLGWLVGLVPAWAMLGFIGWQARLGAQRHLLPTP